MLMHNDEKKVELELKLKYLEESKKSQLKKLEQQEIEALKVQSNSNVDLIRGVQQQLQNSGFIEVQESYNKDKLRAIDNIRTGVDGCAGKLEVIKKEMAEQKETFRIMLKGSQKEKNECKEREKECNKQLQEKIGDLQTKEGEINRLLKECDKKNINYKFSFDGPIKVQSNSNVDLIRDVQQQLQKSEFIEVQESYNKDKLRAIDNIRTGVDGCAKKLEAIKKEMAAQKETFRKMLKGSQKEANECKEREKECNKQLQEKIGDLQTKEEEINRLLKECTNKEDDKQGVITSRMITYNDVEREKCGSHAVYYKSSPEKQVGKHGFQTHDLLKEFFPEMFSNTKIKEALEKGAYPKYGAVNYKFSFNSPISFSWGSPSNMWCNKCKNHPREIACQNAGDQSFCHPAGYYATLEYNKNFFTNVCPNLVYDYGGMAIIKAKLTAPLILVDRSGKMINKEGDNTQVHYSALKHHLKANGTMKDCTGNSRCESFKSIYKEVAWDTDKKVSLKISDNAEKASDYSYDSQDILVFNDSSSLM